ncbi:MAG: UDP-N-acetylmuramoyl-L-alanyl-D-glutamate--2,6-diaminopimelate ligase [Burkholderiaceae bacterium]
MIDQAGQQATLAASLGQWLREVLAPGAALVADSRAVRPGDAFVAWRGASHDGRDYIGQAIARGAAAVLYEGGAEAATGAVASRAVSGLRELAGPIAAEYYGRPSERLEVVAVTGTNGKTSCTQWIARGLAKAGRRAAVIGTLGSGVVPSDDSAPMLDAFGLTTPDAVALQRMLAAFVEGGVEVVAMEASSIGLDQGRLDGTRIGTAVFTNLSRDHLDYHETEEAYLEAKRRLFDWPGLRTAIVNGDDPVAPRILEALPESVQTVAFGQLPGEHGWRARRKLSAYQIVQGRDGTQVSVGGDWGRAQVHLRMIGHFNVVNAMAVAAVWMSLGDDFEDAMRRLEGLRPLPGRMEQVAVDGGPLVVVDYAHSPDALINVLQALRPIADARGGTLWCVFGAGGDRDAGKRPIMGMVAERFADRVVVTSDNPRGESPFRIVSDIRAGFTREPWLTELDREKAIRGALEGAGAEDVVLIAGKGHESWQEIAGQRLPFSDVEVARRCLQQRPEAVRV